MKKMNNIVYDVGVCQKCHKTFRTSDLTRFYCYPCSNFGNRRIYQIFIFSLLYFALISGIDIVSDFCNFTFTRSHIFV